MPSEGKVTQKNVTTSITFFVCLGLKRADKKIGGYMYKKKEIFRKYCFYLKLKQKKCE